MEKFLCRIRSVREDNDLTQAQVAEYLGTSQTMYSRYERGCNEMPIRHLAALCRLYNVSGGLFFGHGPGPQAKDKTGPASAAAAGVDTGAAKCFQTQDASCFLNLRKPLSVFCPDSGFHLFPND